MDNWWAKDNLEEEDSEEEQEEAEEIYEDDIGNCNPFLALDTDPS